LQKAIKAAPVKLPPSPPMPMKAPQDMRAAGASG
jgi:hypothetical protein